jgi:hypothetical protein
LRHDIANSDYLHCGRQTAVSIPPEERADWSSKHQDSERLRNLGEKVLDPNNEACAAPLSNRRYGVSEHRRIRLRHYDVATRYILPCGVSGGAIKREVGYRLVQKATFWAVTLTDPMYFDPKGDILGIFCRKPTRDHMNVVSLSRKMER